MLEQALADIGLTDKEVRVYLAIFSEERMLPSRVSALTGINRASVYRLCEQLETKGLIEKELSKHGTYYAAKRAERLYTLLDKEEAELTEKRHLAKSVIEQLNAKPKETTTRAPKIRIIDGAQFQYYLTEQTPAWEASMKRTKDLTWWGYQEKEFPEHFGAWVKDYWKTNPKGFSTKLITNDFTTAQAEALKSLHPRRTFKFWPHAEFTATLWVHGEYVVLFSLKKKPFYAIEIHNPLFAENLRILFKGMWEMLS